jgi:hypothetical protein
MKTISLVFGAVLFIASTGLAKGPSDLEPPNLVSCRNDGGTVTLHYAASSIGGTPQFALTVDGEPLFPPLARPSPRAEGPVRLGTDATVFGTFVSATDATHAPSDEPTYVYGFFVPSVTLDVGQWVTFPSVILTGSVGGFLPPRSPVQRIDQAIAVECEGSLVLF